MPGGLIFACLFSVITLYPHQVYQQVRLLTRWWSQQALGVRLIANPQVVQLAKNAGYDSVFIDLEHSTLSLNDASNLCIAGLNAGITPFVRVPHQCGNGFVQKVLDGGSMGIIFPHVTSAGKHHCNRANVS